MIEIDGAAHSGSGTLLRYAAVLATLIGEPLHMFRIRQKREKQGLRPQHLQALRACSALCSGRLEGDAVGSREIFYFPGPRLRGNAYTWDIGTAGSTTMLAYTLVPLALFADAASRFTLIGGLFQDFAPSGFHLQRVLFPMIQRMGGEVQLEIQRPGYVPQGEGRIEVSVQPLRAPLEPLRLLDRGRVRAVRGIAISSHLEKEKVSDRMAEQCRMLLETRGYAARIESVYDASAVQKGAALLVWAETTTGCLLGADQAGKRGRRSESIGETVARMLIEDLESGATTDRHLADQLILFAALAQSGSEYSVPQITDHVESNLWLVNQILGVKTERRGNVLKVDGTGFAPSKP